MSVDTGTKGNVDWSQLSCEEAHLILTLLGDYITKKPYGAADTYLPMGKRLFDEIPSPYPDEDNKDWALL